MKQRMPFAVTRPVVIIGGGLTGLTAAYRLVERGVPVTVIERDQRLGGQIHTAHEGPFAIELGAEGFVARSAALPALARAVGVEDALLDQATTLTFALTPDGLVELAPGEAARLLGFQVPKEELGRGIRTLRRGMGQLIDALEAAIGARATWVRGVPASAIEAGPEGPRVILASGEAVDARGVIVTTPSTDAAALCARACSAAEELALARCTSNASATLLYDRSQVDAPLRGSGFIVPLEAQRRGFRACSFVTTKFDRALPPEAVLLRAFFRPSDADLDALDEAGWIALAAESIAAPLGVRGAPERAWASVWRGALAIYDDAWRAIVARAGEALAPLGVYLAGSHFHGAGIDAAVLSAERAAERF